MAIDPARLYTTLQLTGLQNKDNPLYQLLYQLIGALLSVINEQNNGNSGGGGGGSTVIVEQIFGLLAGLQSDIDSIDPTIFMLSSGTSTSPIVDTYAAPLTNGNGEAPEIIFDSFGDVVMVTGLT